MSSEEWAVTPLHSVACFASGRTPARSRQADYFDYGDIFWVKTLDLTNSDITKTDEKITRRAVLDLNMPVHPPGTVLVAMYGGFNQIGRTGILRHPAATNQAMTAILTDITRLDPGYLLHTLNFRVDYWRTVASSSRKDPNITKLDVRNFPLPLPALKEQQAITEALSDTSRQVAILELAITKKQAVKQGVMQQLVVGRTRLPGFSRTWDSEHLGSVLGTVQAGVSVNSVSGPGMQGVLKTSCISGGTFDPSERKTIAPSDIARARVSPRADSLIISRMNTPALVGEVGYVDVDQPTLFLPDRLWLAMGKKLAQVDTHWLGCLLSSSRYRERMREIATGTSGSMKNISRPALLGLQIPLPEIEEQRAISAVFAEVDREIDALRLRLAKARDVKQGMMQQLLTGRTRLAVQE